MDKTEEWRALGKVPDDVYQKCARDGLLLPIAFGKSIPEEFAHYPIIGGIKAKEWNGFHDFVLWDELCRSESISSVFVGLTVGAPPIRQFASKWLQKKILPEILSGQKRICLAVTEPSCGSDVRNLATTAEKSACGKYYIVNGEKKWITNGMYSDYFMTAVRTGGPGADGISFLLIPRTEGIRTRKIEIGADGLSATTYIIFEDVKVPVEYLIGSEGQGFRYVMSNFNHERLWIAFQALRNARTCLQDAMAWAMKREAFGMKLIDQPVVRYKFGSMAKEVEALQAWTEQIVYELDHMSYQDGNRQLGGVTALLKVKGGQMNKFVADNCVQIMGGLGLTKTGQGSRIEAISRSTHSLIVPGGSEDVLIDLGVREALKLSAAKVKKGAKM
ncbi:long-chain specific acyl-CoA dehydrogenase [Histoplasma ohiense]|nr:long-chain specific acyl-CoA dehydrogenase [Histoplasma ohiense (nom. inval.)]